MLEAAHEPTGTVLHRGLSCRLPAHDSRHAVFQAHAHIWPSAALSQPLSTTSCSLPPCSSAASRSEPGACETCKSTGVCVERQARGRYVGFLTYTVGHVWALEASRRDVGRRSAASRPQGARKKAPYWPPCTVKPLGTRVADGSACGQRP